MSKITLRTCVSATGHFSYGIHKPRFTAVNLRKKDYIVTLGHTVDDQPVTNTANFPKGPVHVAASGEVFEIPNAFPFFGATFIPKAGADRQISGCNPFETESPVSTTQERSKMPHGNERLEDLGRPALLALAKASSDPVLLSRLAERSCRFVHDKESGYPTGMRYERTESGRLRPAVRDHYLFEVVSNNPWLPDAYKRAMVLTPGAQGDSPIMGEYDHDGTHIWEYLRENSYIPWGHYAANMAHDAIRYTVSSLSLADIVGLRHLYYQRIYIQLAESLNLSVPEANGPLSPNSLEDLRRRAVEAVETLAAKKRPLPFNGTIWGQNFGFDLSPSGYRLNASHQQIHQQYALVPPAVPEWTGTLEKTGAEPIPTYVQGDLVTAFIREYREAVGRPFFELYLKAIQNNVRTDGHPDKSPSLVYYEDEHVTAFVPKAQRSQGEVQIITKKPVGNIIEADLEVRYSLDRAIWLTMRILEALGARMITIFDLSKRFDDPNCDQHLVYCFLPRHPQSPGSFSEFQQRWIIGHYPEDFAETCRQQVPKLMGPAGQPEDAGSWNNPK
ncbi:MAG: hypothetical protein JRI36_04800 [Deltaproteobacteria bacterium]|nr:hypothetical protein [Deltaproteobacteria bacterium]